MAEAAQIPTTQHARTFTRSEMEARRLSAGRDMKAGVAPPELKRRYGVSRTTVYRWRRMLDQGGEPALHRRKPAGRPPRLNAAEREELRRILAPQASGVRWTTANVALVIQQRFGVSYHRDSIGPILRRLNIAIGGQR